MRLSHKSIITIDGNNPCFKDTEYEGQEFSITLNKLPRSAKTAILKGCVGDNDELDHIKAVKEMFMATWAGATNLEIEVDGTVLDPSTEDYKEAIFEQFSDLADIVAQVAIGSTNEENTTAKNV